MRTGQGFLLVFSITSEASMRELQQVHDELVLFKNDTRVPIVLVGNKADLEEDRAVPRASALATSQGWGNVPYYETSARHRMNVNEVFVDVCRQIIARDKSLRREDDDDGRPDRGDDRGKSGSRHSKRKRNQTRCTIL